MDRLLNNGVSFHVPQPAPHVCTVHSPESRMETILFLSRNNETTLHKCCPCSQRNPDKWVQSSLLNRLRNVLKRFFVSFITR